MATDALALAQQASPREPGAERAVRLLQVQGGWSAATAEGGVGRAGRPARPKAVARAAADARAGDRRPAALAAALVCCASPPPDHKIWVAEHLHDANAWLLLSRAAAGLKLRALRVGAEARAALGDLNGAIDRLRCADGGTARPAGLTSSRLPSSTRARATCNKAASQARVRRQVAPKDPERPERAAAPVVRPRPRLHCAALRLLTASQCRACRRRLSGPSAPGWSPSAPEGKVADQTGQRAPGLAAGGAAGGRLQDAGAPSRQLRRPGCGRRRAGRATAVWLFELPRRRPVVAGALCGRPGVESAGRRARQHAREFASPASPLAVQTIRPSLARVSTSSSSSLLRSTAIADARQAALAWCEVQGLGERIPAKVIEGALRIRAAAFAPGKRPRWLPRGLRTQLPGRHRGAPWSGGRRFEWKTRAKLTAEFSCERERAPASLHAVFGR